MSEQTDNNQNSYSPLTTAGDRIVRTVSRAVETGDYSSLSSDINKELAGIRDDIADMRRPGQKVKVSQKVTVNIGNGSKSFSYQSGSNAAFPGNRQAGTSAAPGQQDPSVYSKNGRNIRIIQRQKNIPTAVTRHQSGSFSAGLMQYGGGFMTFLFGMSAIMNLADSPAHLGGFVACGIFAALFGFVTYRGRQKKKLEKMFQRYARIIGQREFIDLDDLAAAAMETESQTRNNVKLLIKKGVLEGAALDDHEKTLILTQHAYQYYRNAQNEEDKRQKALQETGLQKAPAASASSEQDQLISEGKAFIKEIRDINDKIPDEEMSGKLYKLEDIVNKIFARASEHPENVPALRKFMNYYLPTTRKLLYAYVELNNQPAQGENIVRTRKEIEDAVDTINVAFENLLDSLFSDVAMDISSDISVMKSMMAQDGLAGGSAMHADPVTADSLFGNQKATDKAAVNAGAAIQAPDHLEEGN